MSHPSEKKMNPFPGLRAFRQDEDYLFFGREEQTMELLQRLGGNRFVAVVGTSGSGKSSLVRCGLLSELLGGKMLGAGASWEIAVTHPGGNPLALLTDALLDADLYDAEEENVRENLLATLSRSHFGLVEAVKQADIGEDTNFLLVVDQFEEIFRFHEAGQRQKEAANEFVSILLEAATQKDVPIYVVLTMRSDFIGECGQFEGLAEMVNRGEFLIPRLTREQYKRVIEGPIKVAGGQLAPRLLQRLLNDLGQQADQLPCLQHAMMRTWDVWAQEGDADALDLDDYQRVGRMAEALSLHADEIYDSLASDRQRELCKGMFQALTVQESNSRGIRRPQRLGRLCQILEVSADELIPVIDAYRQHGVTFLMPSPDVALTDQTIIDISHESLMRVWTSLRQWVDEETQAAGIYHRLSESAALHAQEKAGLYRDPELGIALAWQESKHPNEAWAERYRPGFATAMAFLEASQRASVAEDQAREAARQRELEQAKQLAEAQKLRLELQQRAAKRLRKLIAGMAVIAVVACVACIGALIANNNANRLALVADQEAEKARQSEEKTAGALALVEAQKEDVEASLTKAERAEAEAIKAEKKSRKLLYATDMQLVDALLKDEESSARQILSRLNAHDSDQPDNPNPDEDLRGFEWHYFNSLLDSRSTTFRDFDIPVVGSALTVAGELVTLDDDAQVRRFDTATRTETQPPLDLKQDRELGLKILSTDGRMAALAVGNEVHLVDTTTGAELVPAIGAAAHYGMIFSADGTMLITVDTKIAWWDSATGRQIAQDDSKLEEKAGVPVSVSADGLTVAVGMQGGDGRAWSAYRLTPDTGKVTVLQDKFNSNGLGTMSTLAVTPDGKLVAIGYPYSGHIQFLDVVSGADVGGNRSEHASSIATIGFHPECHEMVTGSIDGVLKFWKDYRQLQSGETRDDPETKPLQGHDQSITRAVFSEGGKQVVSSSLGKTTRVWDPKQQTGSTAQPVTALTSPRSVFSPDGLLIVGAGGDREIRVCEAATGRLVRSLHSEGTEPLEVVAVSTDNRLLAAGNGKIVELWDLDSGQRRSALPWIAFTDSEQRIASIAFSPNGKYLAAGIGRFNFYMGQVYEDSRYGRVAVYDVATGRIICELFGHRNSVMNVAFSSDGKLLATASHDRTARIWDTETWQTIHVLDNPDESDGTTANGNGVADVAFSPDGTRLAMASHAGNVHIFDTRSGALVETLRGHAGMVTSVCFSPDGRTLVSGGTDGTVRLWNVATWRQLTSLTASRPESLRFSPDGRQLLAAGSRTIVWSTLPGMGNDPERVAGNLARLLESSADFSTGIRMLSENLRLHEALEKLDSDDAEVQAALAATRANWRASQQRWTEAVAEFERLREINPDKTLAWFRAPSLIRIARALLEEGHPNAAAELVAAASHQMDEDGITSSNLIGILYDRTFPIRVTEVTPDSPASIAGLLAGDIISKVNDVELTEDNVAQLLAGESGTKLRLTVQHAGGEQQEVIQLTWARSFSVPLLNTQLAELRSSVEQRLAATPQAPGVLELRAELHGLVLGAQSQIPDYTAAITLLKSQPTGLVAADLQRLHRRRGNAYFGTEKWQEALDDYDIGITAKISDEVLLVNQVLARVNVLLKDEPSWTVLRPLAMKSEGGATLTLLEDGSILASGKNPDQDAYQITANVPLQRITAIRLEVIPDASLPKHGPGRFSGNGNFHLNEFRVLINGTPHKPEGIIVSFGEHEQYRQIIDGTIDGNLWGINGRAGQRHSAVLATDLEVTSDDKLTLELVSSRGKWPQHNLGRFRLSVSDHPKAYAYAKTRFVTMKQTDPWAKLATAYHLLGDQQAFDNLLEQHPQSVAGIGDLYVMDENWQPAIELYSKLITDQTTDVTLLSKRAAAYIATEQWDLAKADWLRAIELQPDQLQQAFDAFRKAEQWSTAAEFGQKLIEEKPDDSFRWLNLAPVIVLSGDDMAYAEFCQWIAKQPAENFELAERVIKSSLLHASVFDIAALPVSPLTGALESGSHPESFAPWGWGTRGLLAYRSGDADSAVKYVSKSEQHKPGEFAHAMNLTILAMAQHERSQPDEARTALAEALQLITRLKEDPNNKGHHNLLIAEILFREAGAKISGKATSPDKTDE